MRKQLISLLSGAAVMGTMGFSAPEAKAFAYPYYDVTYITADDYWYFFVQRSGAGIGDGTIFGDNSVGFAPALLDNNYLWLYNYDRGYWSYSYYYHTY